MEQFHSIVSFESWNNLKSASIREISLSRVRSALVWIRASRSHWSSTGKDPNGYTLENDLKLVRIADLCRCGSNSSNVNGKPLCAHIGTDPLGSVGIRWDLC